MTTAVVVKASQYSAARVSFKCADSQEARPHAFRTLTAGEEETFYVHPGADLVVQEMHLNEGKFLRNKHGAPARSS